MEFSESPLEFHFLSKWEGERTILEQIVSSVAWPGSGVFAGKRRDGWSPQGGPHHSPNSAAISSILAHSRAPSKQRWLRQWWSQEKIRTYLEGYGSTHFSSKMFTQCAGISWKMTLGRKTSLGLVLILC